jgi:hypothetical protein
VVILIFVRSGDFSSLCDWPLNHLKGYTTRMFLGALVFKLYMSALSEWWMLKTSALNKEFWSSVGVVGLEKLTIW